jgi:excisionase family DNA binding protein
LAPWPEWFSLRQLTEYCGVSGRTVRGWIHAPTDPLPAVQVRGKILIKRSELDRWLEPHIVKSVDLGGMLDEMVEAVTSGR